MAAPKFRPYRGKDSTIQEIPYSNGYVYFATDTGRIYLDYNGERLTMGGNGASLFYANDTDVKQDLMDYYHIDKSTLVDQTASVKINDLIINSDGAFYRVIETETGQDTLQCVRIAVSGTGGGGSSGGGSGGGSGGALTTLVNLDPVPYTFIYGQSYEVRFKATAVNDTKIRITMQIDSSLGQNTVTKTVNSGTEFELDIGSNLFPTEDNRIVVTATTDNSGSSDPKRFTARTAVILELNKSNSFNPREVIKGKDLPLVVVPVGRIDKTLIIYVDGNEVKRELIEANVSGGNYTIDIPRQEHGVHTVRAELTATAEETTITTDPIEYQIAWADPESDIPLVWTPNGYPEKITQYQDLVIEFMVWDPVLKKISTNFYKDGIELSTRLLEYDITKVQRWNITDYQVGYNNYTITTGKSKPLALHILVEKDTERNLEIKTGGLVLNYETVGRSNKENITSKTSWISSTSNKVAAIFEGFNWYNNGWIEDESGRSCLRVSNGASVTIPLTGLDILNTTQLTNSLTFEFRFKVRNVKEYSNLITTTSYEDEEGNVIIEKTKSTDRGVWGKLYNDLGLCLGTQEAFFSSAAKIVNVRYREDEIINLSVVIDNSSSKLPLISIYLQGILSGIVKYIPDADSFNANTSNLIINSKECDVDIYNIRIYKGAKLESSDIVHNYIADRKDVKAYDANQFALTENNMPIINYNDMVTYNSSHPDETIIPYMIITPKSTDGLLPFVKGGKKAVDIEFHNPALDYAYEKGYITDEQYLHGAPSFYFSSAKKSLDVQGTSSQGYPRRNYKWKAKQEDAIWRYLAGPLKDKPIYEFDKAENKFKGSKHKDISYKKYYLDSDIGESTFCFKADYMESSSTHNTGYASYVSTLYNKHPLKDYLPSGTVLPNSIRTTIYGFPMLIFQKNGTSYEFVGRYNFNLDKSATDTCGFSYDAVSKVKDGNYRKDENVNAESFSADKHYIKVGDEYQKATSYVEGQDYYYIRAYYPIEEIAECWEICNNQGSRTSFTRVDFEETTDAYSEVELTSDTFKPNTYYIVSKIDTSGNKTYILAEEYNANDIYYSKSSGILSVLDDFEYRYSFYKDEIDEAIKGIKSFANKDQAERNQAILYRMRNFKDFATWLESTDIQDPNKLGQLLGTYTEVSIRSQEELSPEIHYVWNSTYRKWEKVTDETIYEAGAKYSTCVPQPVTIGLKTYDFDTKEYRLARFGAEFSQHLDLEYCTIYFIMTELLHLYDSRGKNCMMATWGPQVEGGEYIWYPIFYDIDTQLGINNSGVPTWDYFIEATETGQFSTSNGVLWNNMWQDSTYKNHIKNRYIELRKEELTIDNMDGYYNSHPILGRGDIDSWKDIMSDDDSEDLRKKIVSFAKIGKKPAMIYNVDEYYKYIAPAVSGYINTSGKNAKTDTFFYCLQGTRELMRYLYLRNRLNFIDSKWLGGSYSKEAIKGEFQGRYNANHKGQTSDKYLRTTDIEQHKQPGTEEKAGFIMWHNESKGPNPLDCPTDFKGIRTFLKQYVPVLIDDTILSPVYCDAIQKITLSPGVDKERRIQDTPNFTQQLFYLGGSEYIADLGDLGLKYLDQFFGAELQRIQSLRLGSDVPGYYNSQFTSETLKIGGGKYDGEGNINKKAKTLLEEVVLTGLTSYNDTVDLSGSEKLKIFRALNTTITGVNLADGVQIETLHLPNTITFLDLTEPVALHGILSAPGSLAEGKFNPGLYIAGITDATDLNIDIPIMRYSIIGGNLGYDSYRLLDTLTKIKVNMQKRNAANSSLAINLENVNWSPYTVVEYGEAYDEEKSDLYYYDNERFQLKHYTYNKDTWELSTKNGKIYLYNPNYAMANADVLTDMSIFDKLIKSYEEAMAEFTFSGGISGMNINYFPNTIPNQTKPSIAEITGLIHVNNAIAIDEAEVANKYLKYFPKVQFFFTNVKHSYTAVYVTSIDGVEKTIFTERKPEGTSDLSLTFPSLDKYTPIRLNYDFMGWCLNIDGNGTVYHPVYLDDPDTTEVNEFEVEWAKLKYTNTSTPIKFYAIFESTKYAVHFMNYFKNGTTELITTEYVTAGEHLYEPNVLPATDESDLDDEKRYKLLGWVSDTKYCYPKDEAEGLKHIVNLSNILSENMDRTYYACYIEESVSDSVTNPDYFEFTSTKYTDPVDPNYTIEGYSAQPRSGVKLQGKITIPGTYNGAPVIEFRGLNSTPGLTHIYFENPETLRRLDGLDSNPDLKIVDFPSGLREITSSALSFCPKLHYLDKFAKTKLVTVGSSIFAGSFNIDEGQIEKFELPGTLVNIRNSAFMAMGPTGIYPPAGQYRIVEVSFGRKEDPSQLILGNVPVDGQIFWQNVLNSAPADENASENTPIKSFTFYKEAGAASPTQQEFEEFVRGNRVTGSNETLNISVVETTKHKGEE